MIKFVYSIIVGTFFFGALAIVGYFTIITEGGPLKKESYSMKIYFSDADGIKIGNKVTVHGVPHGYVSKIRLVQIDENGKILEGEDDVGIGTRVEITITLPTPLKLYDNNEITLKNESLLSGRVIAINPGSAFEYNSKTKEINLKSRMKEPLDLSNKLNPYILKGKTTEDPLVTLSEMISENRSDIRSTISNISEITNKINTGDGTLARLINKDDIHKNVNTTLSDSQIVLRELREGLEDTREQAPITSVIRAMLSAF